MEAAINTDRTDRHIDLFTACLPQETSLTHRDMNVPDISKLQGKITIKNICYQLKVTNYS